MCGATDPMDGFCFLLLSAYMCIIRGSLDLKYTQYKADVMTLSNIFLGNLYFIRKCGFVFFSRSLRMSLSKACSAKSFFSFSFSFSSSA